MNPRTFALLAIAVFLAPALPAQTVGPDLAIADITGVANYNPSGGIEAIAVGTLVRNDGDQNLAWDATSASHPVVAQSCYRLYQGRLEMIGQSWVKHAFLASDCGGAAPVLPGGCASFSSAANNGIQLGLGPKSEVDAAAGTFVDPPTDLLMTGDSVYKRLQLDPADLDPASFPGARYFVEVQGVAADDAAAGNSGNNSAYREVVFTGGPNNYVCDLAPSSTTVPEPVSFAWRALASRVQVVPIAVPGDGRMLVGLRSTPQPGGAFQYDVTIQNVDSDRGARRLSVSFPSGAGITNVRFHDVGYHSGELVDGTDWPVTIGTDHIEWSTATFAQDPLANAVRWGATYSFSFTSDIPPVGQSIDLEIELFKPGAGGVIPLSLLPQGSFQVIGGQAIAGNAGEPFAEPIVVELIDAFGTPITGATITFTKVGGTADLVFANGGIATTGSDGRATMTVTGGPDEGDVVIEIQSGGDSLITSAYVRRFERLWFPSSAILVFRIYTELDDTPVTLAIDDPAVPVVPTPFGDVCTRVLDPAMVPFARSGAPGAPYPYDPALVTNGDGYLQVVIPMLHFLVGSGITANHQMYAFKIIDGQPHIYVSSCITATY